MAYCTEHKKQIVDDLWLRCQQKRLVNGHHSLRLYGFIVAAALGGGNYGPPVVTEGNNTCKLFFTPGPIHNILFLTL